VDGYSNAGNVPCHYRSILNSALDFRQKKPWIATKCALCSIKKRLALWRYPVLVASLSSKHCVKTQGLFCHISALVFRVEIVISRQKKQDNPTKAALSRKALKSVLFPDSTPLTWVAIVPGCKCVYGYVRNCGYVEMQCIASLQLQKSHRPLQKSPTLGSLKAIRGCFVSLSIQSRYKQNIGRSKNNVAVNTR